MTATLQALPAGWLPAAKMQRVICHWTAGHHKASEDDKAHYHILIEDDGRRNPRQAHDRPQCRASQKGLCRPHVKLQHWLDWRVAMLHGAGNGKSVQSRQGPDDQGSVGQACCCCR